MQNWQDLTVLANSEAVGISSRDVKRSKARTIHFLWHLGFC